MYRFIIKTNKQNSLKIYTDKHRYLIFTHITNNRYMFNSKSVLENPFANDLLIGFGYLWVPIVLEKKTWKDIELLGIYAFGLFYAW